MADEAGVNNALAAMHVLAQSALELPAASRLGVSSPQSYVFVLHKLSWDLLVQSRCMLHPGLLV